MMNNGGFMVDIAGIVQEMEVYRMGSQKRIPNGKGSKSRFKPIGWAQ